MTVRIKPEPLKAVHDSDLRDLLERLELWNKFNAGQLKCSFCGDVIDWDNLHAIFPDSGAIKFGCSRPECVEDLNIRLSELYDK